jgi:hypothetical protein
MSRDHKNIWFLVGITSNGINDYDAYVNQQKYPGKFSKRVRQLELQHETILVTRILSTNINSS